MSMWLYIYRGSDTELFDYLDHLKIGEEVAAQSPSEMKLFYLFLRAKVSGKSFNRSDFVPEFEEKEYPEAKIMEIEWTWQALHYLITNGDEDMLPPHGFLGAGEELDQYPALSGYGYGWYHNSNMVESINTLLQELTEADLRSRFIPDKMNDIYKLNLYTAESAQQDLEAVLEDFSELKKFVSLASSQNESLMLHIS